MTDSILGIGPEADESMLWALFSDYNWDDGYSLPLAVVRHPRCDRALALRLFWELDDTARIHLSDEDNALGEHYGPTKRYQPEEFERLVAYATTLVDGIRRGAYPEGANTFDTGFMESNAPELSESKRKLRALRTKRALAEYDEAFLRPAMGRR